MYLTEAEFYFGDLNILELVVHREVVSQDDFF